MRPIRLLGVALGLAAASLAAHGQSVPTDDRIDPNARAAAASIPFIPDVLVEELARRLDGQRRASERVTNPVLALSADRTITVDLGSGGATPIVQTVMGYPTSIIFLDGNGRSWPIHWDVSSNPTIPAAPGVTNASAGVAVGPAISFGTGFEVDVPVKGGNVLNITTRSPGPRGGLAVMLEGSSAPLSFLLLANSRRFDSRLAVKVTGGDGPHAKTAAGSGFGRPGGPVTGSAQLSSMLDGVAPAQAVPLGVVGMSPDDIRAWRLGDRIYLRTRAKVVSPQPVGREFGMDGVAIYEIPAVPSVLVVSGGQLTPIHLQER